MFMRYLWGLAVGHVYTHKHTAGNAAASAAGVPLSSHEEPSGSTASALAAVTRTELDVTPDYDTDGEDAQFGFENLQDDYLGDDDTSQSGHGSDLDDSDSDEMAVTMDDMYGPSDSLDLY
jgi:hypothetical protein